MLLFTEDEYAARAAILRALEAGRLTEERIDASVARILEAKEWAGLDRKRAVELEEVRRHVATQPHEAFSETVARSSLTLLRNENDVLPLDGNNRRILSVTLSDGSSLSTGQTFTDHLRRQAGRLTTRLLDRRSHDVDYQQVLREAARYDVILVPTHVRVRSWSGQITLSSEHRRFSESAYRQGEAGGGALVRQPVPRGGPGPAAGRLHRRLRRDRRFARGRCRSALWPEPVRGHAARLHSGPLRLRRRPPPPADVRAHGISRRGGDAQPQPSSPSTRSCAPPSRTALFPVPPSPSGGATSS